MIKVLKTIFQISNQEKFCNFSRHLSKNLTFKIKGCVLSPELNKYAPLANKIMQAIDKRIIKKRVHHLPINSSHFLEKLKRRLGKIDAQRHYWTKKISCIYLNNHQCRTRECAEKSFKNTRNIL
ncbi:hypothetical protein [Arachidicoccus sp.]|uniref:hypothetical protein n=1 Tax=Arachidicoccus sp. TaxID=1872624 RepID=UPI003D1E2B04